jgi:hypothetical protein
MAIKDKTDVALRLPSPGTKCQWMLKHQNIFASKKQ